MTIELALYKFCQDKEIKLQNNELLLWIPFDNIAELFDNIAELAEIVGYNYFSDNSEKVNLSYDCICIDLAPICEYLNINPLDII